MHQEYDYLNLLNKRNKNVNKRNTTGNKRSTTANKGILVATVYKKVFR